MPKLLKSNAFDIKNGLSIEVEVPGYSKEDVSVEIKPYTYELFGIPMETKGLYVSANNDKRGKSETVLQIINLEKFNLDDVSAEVINGLLTVEFPYSRKFRDRIIPVT